MIQAVIDRIEGNYVVAEISPILFQAFCIDILKDNFKEKISVGDVIQIISVNGIDLSDENRCVYKDISRPEVLKKFLEPLNRAVDCKIEISTKQSHERSSQVKSMISDLFK